MNPGAVWNFVWRADSGTEFYAIVQSPHLIGWSLREQTMGPRKGRIALDVMDALEVSVIPESKIVRWRIRPPGAYWEEVPILLLHDVPIRDLPPVTFATERDHEYAIGILHFHAQEPSHII